jgi:hypothetical protein
MASSAVRRHTDHAADYSPAGLEDYLRALPATDVVETV